MKVVNVFRAQSTKHMLESRERDTQVVAARMLPLVRFVDALQEVTKATGEADLARVGRFVGNKHPLLVMVPGERDVMDAATSPEEAVEEVRAP